MTGEQLEGICFGPSLFVGVQASLGGRMPKLLVFLTSCVEKRRSRKYRASKAGVGRRPEGRAERGAKHPLAESQRLDVSELAGRV